MSLFQAILQDKIIEKNGVFKKKIINVNIRNHNHILINYSNIIIYSVSYNLDDYNDNIILNYNRNRKEIDLLDDVLKTDRFYTNDFTNIFIIKYKNIIFTLNNVYIRDLSIHFYTLLNNYYKITNIFVSKDIIVTLEKKKNNVNEKIVIFFSNIDRIL